LPSGKPSQNFIADERYHQAIGDPGGCASPEIYASGGSASPSQSGTGLKTVLSGTAAFEF
jgi:hypothetical protein